MIPKPRGGDYFCDNWKSVSLISGNNIPVLCLPLAIVGAFDDFSNISASKRYFAQLLTVIVLFYFSNFNELLRFDFPYILIIGIYFVLIIAGTAVINFSNFMDGIDGLVGGCFTVILISAAFINDLSFLPLLVQFLDF